VRPTFSSKLEMTLSLTASGSSNFDFLESSVDALVTVEGNNDLARPLKLLKSFNVP